jgi:hydroxyacylglutathione hydrolase
MEQVVIEQLLLGPMENFVYLIKCPETRTCMVVDPAWDVDAIVKKIESQNLKLEGILVSHFHPDHCGGHIWGHDIEGVAELVNRLPVPIFANRHEVDGLVKITGLAPSAFKSCDGGDKLPIGKSEVTLIHTPGHTPGSQCFLCHGNLVSGDTLFITGCGRVDLPGGNSEQLFDSLHNKIAKLPANTMLYPGHNYDAVKSATLDHVKRHNPYLQVDTLDQWRGKRG